MRSGTSSPRRLVAGIAAVSLLVLTACSGAGDEADATGTGTGFPSGPLEIVVGAPAGGSTDLLARRIAESLGTVLGQDVTVLNQPGDHDVVAAGEVARSAPDGQRMMLAPGSLMTITPAFVTPEAALALDKIQVVTGVGREDYVLVAERSSDLTSIADLADAGRAIDYGTAGVGTVGQLSQRLLFEDLGVGNNHVPFEGGAPTVAALLAGEVDVISVPVAEAMPHIESGAFTPIATFGSTRSPFLPDVATAAEQGHEVLVDESSFVWVPLGTPATTVTALDRAYRQVFAEGAYRTFLAQSYITPDETDAAATAQSLHADRTRHQRDVITTGIAIP